jgi:hypothetical protein
MTIIDLTVRDERGELAVLRRDTAGTTLHRVSADVRGDFERIVLEGIAEWIGEIGQKRQRITRPNDPQFFERLAGYLARLGLTTTRSEHAVVRFNGAITSTTPRQARSVAGTTRQIQQNPLAASASWRVPSHVVAGGPSNNRAGASAYASITVARIEGVVPPVTNASSRALG